MREQVQECIDNYFDVPSNNDCTLIEFWRAQKQVFCNTWSETDRLLVALIREGCTLYYVGDGLVPVPIARHSAESVAFIIEMERPWQESEHTDIDNPWWKDRKVGYELMARGLNTFNSDNDCNCRDALFTLHVYLSDIKATCQQLGLRSFHFPSDDSGQLDHYSFNGGMWERKQQKSTSSFNQGAKGSLRQRRLAVCYQYLESLNVFDAAGLTQGGLTVKKIYEAVKDDPMLESLKVPDQPIPESTFRRDVWTPRDRYK